MASRDRKDSAPKATKSPTTKRAGSPFVVHFLPSRTRVGVDGVAVRWLGRTRFIRIAEITGVRADTFSALMNMANAVVITLRSGDTYRLPTNQSFYSGSKLAKEIVAQIERARRLAERTRVEPSASLPYRRGPARAPLLGDQGRDREPPRSRRRDDRARPRDHRR